MLKAKIDPVLATTAQEWSNYGLRPVQVVTSPDSPFHTDYMDLVSVNLQYEIDEQQPNGSWDPVWNWGDVYPDIWPGVCREWSGILTLNNLVLLSRFGRIEGGTLLD